MQILVTGHHVEVTDAIRNHVESKLERIGRRSDDIISANVILNVEKLANKAEATLQLQGGTAHAEDVSDDMYVAIDNMIEKLDRQLMKQKDKKQNFRNVGKTADQLHSEEIDRKESED